MCKVANNSSAYNYAANPYTYGSVERIQDIAAIMQSLARTGPVALVTITLHFPTDEYEEPQGKQKLEPGLHYFLHSLRSLVRKTDPVLLLNQTCYFLLAGANLQGAEIVQERLWEALLWRVHNANEQELVTPGSMKIGHSAYPIPQRNLQQCIREAQIEQLSFELLAKEANAAHELSTEQELALPALARQLGVPYLSLLPRRLPANVKDLVSAQLAQELSCYPLGHERDTLTVAMTNPHDNEALDRLRRETGMRIFPVLVHPQELATVLKHMI